MLCLPQGVQAQETVKLEWKLAPGTEVTYKAEDTLKETGFVSQRPLQATGTESYDIRLIVVEADPKTGTALIGQLIHAKHEATMTSPRQETFAETNDLATALRMDRTGEPIPLAYRSGNYESAARKPLDERTLDALPLPAQPVAVGATWESSVATSNQLWVKFKTVSTLAEVKEVDGRLCALITSKFSPLPTHSNFQVTSGEAQSLFDIEQGAYREVNEKFVVSSVEKEDKWDVEYTLKTRLAGVREIPPDEMAADAKMIRAIDDAVAKARNNKGIEAVADLESLTASPIPGDWKNGLAGTVKQVREQCAVDYELKLDPVVRLMRDAFNASQDRDWKEAVSKFSEVVEKYPDHARVPEALHEAARIYKLDLRDKAKADELEQKRLAVLEKRAEGNDPQALNDLACAYQEFDDPDRMVKALDTFSKLLSSESNDAKAVKRIRAQYDIGGVLERLGRTDEALAAFRSAENMPGEDASSKLYRDLAKNCIARLSRSAPPAK